LLYSYASALRLEWDVFPLGKDLTLMLTAIRAALIKGFRFLRRRVGSSGVLEPAFLEGRRAGSQAALQVLVEKLVQSEGVQFAR